MIESNLNHNNDNIPPDFKKCFRFYSHASGMVGVDRRIVILCGSGFFHFPATPISSKNRPGKTLPLMLLIRDEAIRGKSWFSRFSANSPSIFAKPTDYDT